MPTCLSDKFSIEYEETVGRNGVALTDINFGDVLLIDKPIVMRSRAGNQFCTHCLVRFKTKQIYKSPFGDEVDDVMLTEDLLIMFLFRVSSVHWIAWWLLCRHILFMRANWISESYSQQNFKICPTRCYCLYV